MFSPSDKEQRMSISELLSERKSIERLAFEYWLRSGRHLTTEAELLEAERKFNPYHDPDDGRFTSGPGGSSGGSASMGARPKAGTARYPVRIVLPAGNPKQTTLIRNASTATRSKESVARFSHSAGIDLPDEVVSKANALADSVHLATGQRIHVTSGRRGVQRQAEAMYDNYLDGTEPSYANTAAEKEVHRAYLSGLNKKVSRDRTIASMANVLAAQTKRGIYLSRHMRSNAIDIRTPSASVLRAIRRHPDVQSVGVENDHIHIQFR
jgi:hypothetical protein